MAIILTTDKTKYKEKDTGKLAEEFRYSMSFDKAVEVVSDFFIAQGLGEMMQKTPQPKATKKKR